MPESLQVLTVEGVISVYTAGVLLTIAGYMLGMKIGIVIGVIRKI
ncbi:MAG: hypothetical protein ACRD9S_21370 [Pyrinomonadaceae bacterium]